MLQRTEGVSTARESGGPRGNRTGLLRNVSTHDPWLRQLFMSSTSADTYLLQFHIIIYHSNYRIPFDSFFLKMSF